MNMLPSRIFFDQFLDDFTKEDKMRCDIYEKEGIYHIEADVPGFNKEDINYEDLLKITLKDINAADAIPGGGPLTDKYLLCVKGNYSTPRGDFWDIGGKNMTTNNNGGLCRIYSMYGTGGVNWLVDALMDENDMYFAKMVFCFKQMVNIDYDYTRNHTDLLSTCSNIDGGYEYGLGTPEALKKAVTDGDAVFVYRDDLLNFTKFVQEKLNVTVE